MFGTAKTNGGLFSQPQQQQGGLFSGKPGGSFGNLQQPVQQTGQTDQTTRPAQPAQPAQTGQPGGIFANQQLAQSQQTSLFSNTAPKPSLFGAQTSQTQQTPQTGGIFGQTNQQTQPSGQQSGIFGSQPPKTGGLFGNSQSQTNTAQTGILANKPMFAMQNQPPPAAPQQNPVITPFTRPSDLPEQFQRTLEDMDGYIRSQQQLSEDLGHATTEHRRLVESIPRDVQLLRFKLTSATETLKFDDSQLAKLKQLVDGDYSDAELLQEVVNQPRKYDRLLPYFNKSIDCESRLDQLALATRDVQHAVTAEEFGKRVTFDSQSLQALPAALKEEYLYFMELSDRVAELHRHIKVTEESEVLDDMRI